MADFESEYVSGFSPCGQPLDKDGRVIPRLFIPRGNPKYQHMPKSQLVVYREATQISHLRWLPPGLGPLEAEKDTLVLWIDGASRSFAEQPAQASWGVYFGPGSRYNACGRLPAEPPLASSCAVTEALGQALHVVGIIARRHASLRHVCILTSSMYLVKTMVVWIKDIIDRGGIPPGGERPHVNFARLKEAKDLLDSMTSGHAGVGLEFKFWPIQEEENMEARELAQWALDENNMDVCEVAEQTLDEDHMDVRKMTQRALDEDSMDACELAQWALDEKNMDACELSQWVLDNM